MANLGWLMIVMGDFTDFMHVRFTVATGVGCELADRVTISCIYKIIWDTISNYLL